MKRLYISILLALTAGLCFSQNTISVPFSNGFIGVNTGNNSSNSVYYLNGAQGVGWTSIRFAQTTNGTVFTQQGNDIAGEVWITDNAGTYHEIPGFIKWRTPSGNNPHTMVFQPSPGTYIMATNGFNGSSTYTLDETNYIGLTKAGSTLTISPVPGVVTGNSSSNGLLDALNDILGELPHLKVQGTIVPESDGIAETNVSLSSASSLTVNVYFNTYSNTALPVDDYDSTYQYLTFLPGDTLQTIAIPITVDGTNESDESFLIRIFESTNAAITTSQDSVVITETTLPVTLLSASVQCSAGSHLIQWSTASEQNSDFFEIVRSENGIEWESIGTLPAQGTSNQEVHYEFNNYRDCKACQTYYKIKQIDFNGQVELLTTLAANCSPQTTFNDLKPNPANEKVHLSVNLQKKETINLNILDLTGKTIKSMQFEGTNGQNVFEIDIHDLPNGTYLIHANCTSLSFTERLQVIE